MFAKVHPPTDIKGGNKGSCYDLATYLNKEQGTGQNFFSHTEDNVTVEDVIININNNKKAILRAWCLFGFGLVFLLIPN